ncbi:Peptidase M20 domain-containing protein 2 [Fonsecaea pedrosoi]|nr:Peptidase M20 domain-containing protein 2 [Fonsecaea pedrosoi]
MAGLNSSNAAPDATVTTALKASLDAIDAADAQLRELNRAIHDNPELAYKEFFAVKTISAFLKKEGFAVTEQTYGLETSFTSEVGQGGPLVIICAEYDALPGIGHACGHNLIATSSIAAFLGAATALKSSGIPGRVRLLGTPAEEGGGGKCKLIDAGAFRDKDIGAAIMAHPVTAHQFSDGYTGLAGLKFIASHKFRVEFRGQQAHAAGEPWNGVNALDAAITTYNSVSMLRQQMRPDERVHGVIEDGGSVPNVITAYTRMNWYVRAPNVARADKLLAKVHRCCEAAAAATSCEINFITAPTYKNLRVNLPLCKQYVEDMAMIGEKIMVKNDESYTASTDMVTNQLIDRPPGNVSFEVPSFHGTFPIPTEPNVSMHHPRFAGHAATDDAHRAAITCAKGMAMLALRVLTDPRLVEEAWKDFENFDD